MIFNLDDAGIKNFGQVKPGDIDWVQSEHKTVVFSIAKGSQVEIVYALKND